MTPVPGPWAARTDGRRYLSSERQIVASVGEYLGCRRFTSLQQTRLVSLNADHPRRSQNAPMLRNGFYHRAEVNPSPAAGDYRRRLSLTARCISRLAVLRAMSRRLSYSRLQIGRGGWRGG